MVAEPGRSELGGEVAFRIELPLQPSNVGSGIDQQSGQLLMQRGRALELLQDRRRFTEVARGPGVVRMALAFQEPFDGHIEHTSKRQQLVGARLTAIEFPIFDGGRFDTEACGQLLRTEALLAACMSNPASHRGEGHMFLFQFLGVETNCGAAKQHAEAARSM